MSTPAKPKAHIQVRRGQYRGHPGWHILGKDQSGASVRMFSFDESGAEARRMAGEIRAGKEPHFDTELARSAANPSCDVCTKAVEFVSASCFCTPEQLERKETPLRALQEIADRLRETAVGLRAWDRHTMSGLPIPSNVELVNPWHAANRLEQMAERISAKERARADR